MNIDDIKILVATANDATATTTARNNAFKEADEGRKTLKIGWSKLGLSVEQVKALRDTLAALPEDLETASEEQADNLEPTASEEPEQAPTVENDTFSMTAEEIAAQTDRPKSQEQLDAEDNQAIERATKKVAKAKADGTGEVRGGLTRIVESLLMDPALSYLDIINAVLQDFPKANTSARSIASVAAGLRRKGVNVPMRRPAKAVAAPTEEQVATSNGERQAIIDALES